MTSTTSSNNKASLLYKWALRRNRPVMIVFSILMVVGILIDINAISWTGNTSEAAMIDAKYTIGLASIIIAQVGAIVMSLISTLITFSFLHNKRSVDMYGAFPVKRETIFITHLLASMTAVGAPYVLGSLVVIGLTAASENIGMFMLFLLFGILGIAAASIFTTLISYCCGTTIDTIITAIGLNAVYAGVIGLYGTLMSNMIPGVEAEEILTTPLIALLCPYAFCFFADAYKGMEEDTSLMIMLFWMIIYTAAAFYLAFRMAKRRKAEVAQGGFAISWIPIVVKVGASVVCGGLVGSIAAASSNNKGFGIMVMYSVWYIIMGAAAFAITNIIIERGFKGNWRKSIIAYGCTTVVFLASLFALTTGLGIDTYVPIPENVKSVSINYEETSTDPENIKTITEIHKSIAESIHNSDMRPYYPFADTNRYNYYYTDASTERDDTNEKYPLVDRCDFKFTYKKKVGISTYRGYYIYPSRSTAKIYDLDKLESLLEKYYSSEEYKKTQNTPLWGGEMPANVKLETSTPPSIKYMMYNDHTNVTNDDYYYGSNYTTLKESVIPYNKTFLSGLYEALREDILADNKYYTQLLYQSNHESKEIFGDGYIALDVNYTYDYTSAEGYKSIYGNWGRGVHLVIKPEYKKTMAYLKEHYIETEATVPEEYASQFKMTAAGYMDALQSLDGEEKVEPYIEFGMTGKVEQLLKAVDAASELMEGTALTRMGTSIEDYDAWNEAHGKEFKEQLNRLAQAIYDDYPLKHEARPDYTNPFLQREGLAGDWYYLEDKIFEELDNRITEIVIELNKTPKSVEGDKPAAGA